MSFILDALKKSESDRQRQTGPALFEVKVAPPKVRFPLWAVAIVALLVVNMVIVGYLLIRHSASSEETSSLNATPAAPSNTAPPRNNAAPQASAYVSPAANVPPSAGAPPDRAMNTPSQSNAGTVLTIPPPGTSAPQGGSNAYPQGADNMQRQGSADSPQQGTWDPQRPAHLPSRNQEEPTLAGNARDTSTNPDDYAPATEEPNSSVFKGHVKRGTESGLMLYQDLAVTTGSDLPQIRLDLHVYAAKPEDRFALINMHKLHEGDSIPGDVHVESITPDGVIMSHNGTKFLLPRE